MDAEKKAKRAAAEAKAKADAQSRSDATQHQLYKNIQKTRHTSADSATVNVSRGDYGAPQPSFSQLSGVTPPPVDPRSSRGGQQPQSGLSNLLCGGTSAGVAISTRTDSLNINLRGNEIYCFQTLQPGTPSDYISGGTFAVIDGRKVVFPETIRVPRIDLGPFERDKDLFFPPVADCLDPDKLKVRKTELPGKYRDLFSGNALTRI